MNETNTMKVRILTPWGVEFHQVEYTDNLQDAVDIASEYGTVLEVIRDGHGYLTVEGVLYENDMEEDIA